MVDKKQMINNAPLRLNLTGSKQDFEFLSNGQWFLSGNHLIGLEWIGEANTSDTDDFSSFFPILLSLHSTLSLRIAKHRVVINITHDSNLVCRKLDGTKEDFFSRSEREELGAKPARPVVRVRINTLVYERTVVPCRQQVGQKAGVLATTKIQQFFTGYHRETNCLKSHLFHTPTSIKLSPY